MPTLEEVRAQINNLPPELRYVFYTKREIACLPDLMVDGEYIRAAVSGYVGKKTVLVACTNKRLLFINKGMILGMNQWQISLDRIQSMDGSYIILFGNIKVWDGAAATLVTMVLASRIDPFIKEVRRAIDDYKHLTYQEAAAVASAHVRPQAVDVASQIERLVQLMNAGHITQEEFQAQKARILNG
ncbi:MAG: hypothetical protein EAY65_01575 [Alphaproteobacteria bacterium]|nr:MAG: hypothetical protein EAY65_01575 [Alphaproteobacteria bacterium]TAE82176.1 MAG: hypothetical protein EAY76_03540 [Alphaproteobacteria bacterium]TAF40453.1 MAG: hypothetical protein EAZ66_03100 [Alphaproteobacteria bacterium]TAF76550.1 MAG: hypothetical protein EAZ52_03870 [Alphaproteobacteria bacterium]